MRLTLLSSSVVAAVALSLSACAATPSPSAQCDPVLNAGSLTDTIQVQGSFGKKPTIVLPDDTATETSQRAVLSTDDRLAAKSNRVAKPGDLVSLNFVILDGGTGKELESSEFSPTSASAPVIIGAQSSFPALSDGLVCAKPGDRILIAAAPADGLGPEGNANLGIADDATLVLVADVIEVGAMRSEGPIQLLPNGFPNVVTTDSGQVGIVLPPSAPPSDSRVAQRVVGDGAIVKATDTVFAQVLTVGWNSRQVIASTWEQNAPVSLGTEADGYPIRAEVTGYTVGSQIVVIAPGQSGPEVSVIDIIGVGE